jgi:hypothetical protein
MTKPPFKPGLQAAFLRGEPLADVSIHFVMAVDYAGGVDRLNLLADDFVVTVAPYYADYSRMATGTRGALERLFGWRLIRERLPGTDSSQQIYWWKELNRPTHYPAGFDGIISNIGLSQPGADDDCQWFDYSNH